MPTSSRRRAIYMGPAAVAIIGLIAIGIGAAIKTGFIEVRRGGPARADSTEITVRTGAGAVGGAARQRRRVGQRSHAHATSRTITPSALAGDTVPPQLRSAIATPFARLRRSWPSSRSGSSFR